MEISLRLTQVDSWSMRTTCQKTDVGLEGLVGFLPGKLCGVCVSAQEFKKCSLTGTCLCTHF